MVLFAEATVTRVTKTAAIVAFAFAAASSQLQAADIYTPPPEQPPPVYAPVSVYSWTGFYVGAHAGYSWGDSTSDTPFNVPSINGWLLGGQAGYNYMFPSNIVVGIEGDIAWSGQEGSTAGPVGSTITQSIDWLGTVRARLGYAFGNWMPYITGGFAVAGATRTSSLGGGFSETKTHTGHVLGAGLEWAFAPNWTANLGYQYVSLGAQTYTAIPADPSVSITDHIVRLGLNYKF
jgi:opacity protein-like surface antigen